MKLLHSISLERHARLLYALSTFQGNGCSLISSGSSHAVITHTEARGSRQRTFVPFPQWAIMEDGRPESNGKYLNLLRVFICLILYDFGGIWGFLLIHKVWGFQFWVHGFAHEPLWFAPLDIYYIGNSGLFSAFGHRIVRDVEMISYIVQNSLM